ncbi:MAG: hypothetical protein NXH75_11370 [Halobacteriovoraceae bacterium]|nr:hypothetical protein [Halobacteriovoraceae bacterium]
MNKISLYTLLILLFLGVSKSFSPSAQKTTYIQNDQVLASLSDGAPVSLILIDAFEAGFLIKTYYLRFKLVHGFKTPEYLVVRTNKTYFKENQKNIGMSLFRRYERNKKESTIPLPPGSIYVGDPAFGGWRYANSGERQWHFHKVYRHFSRQFYWGEYRPNYEFFQKVQTHLKSETAFYGLKNEFGKDGVITKALYENSPYRTKNKELNFLEQLKRYITLPQWNKHFQREKGS